MSTPPFPQPEQDKSGDGGLPTYDALAAEAGPNSRFGRWRSWIEKRAAERYADITPEDAARRLARGWGESINTAISPTAMELESATSSVSNSKLGGTLELEAPLRIDTTSPSPSSCTLNSSSSPAPSLPLVGDILSPTHLQVNQFGSRFLPHSAAPIRCVLPILSDRLILIGHDDGLSVLNMFPKEWTETGLAADGPSAASARVIWEGEAVYQLSLLEVEDIGASTPTGVVLALVGSSPDDETVKDTEATRSLRMYNLSSLISLASWAVSNQYSAPMDLRRSPAANPQRGSVKKSNIPLPNITKAVRSWPPDLTMSSKNTLSSSSNVGELPTPVRSDSDGSTTSWDVVEDLPLRWASDYVPLSANPSSRLSNTPILFYETWADDSGYGRKGSLLAVATKSAVLLYEAPRGQRAFKFVKEFYTPVQPRAMTFVYQAEAEPIFRSPSDTGHTRLRSSNRVAAHTSHQRSTSSVVPSIRYSNLLSLFVILDRKAGLIRITDATVGEIEFYEEGTQMANLPTKSRDSINMSTFSRRQRASWDGFGFHKEKPLWILPTKVDLSPSIAHSDIYLLTRARRTHILPCPLPSNLTGSYSPLFVLTWSCTPKHVRGRVCHPSSRENKPPFLQVIAFGENGIEVQETPFYLLSRTGKSTAAVPVPSQATEDLGGETGPLCVGGCWHLSALHSEMSRTSSAFSYATSLDSLDSDELIAKLKEELGIYAWVQKGLADWRVFWVGGTGSTGEQRA